LTSTSQLFSLFIFRINDKAILSAVTTEHTLEELVCSTAKCDKEHEDGLFAVNLDNCDDEPQDKLLSSKSNSSTSSVVDEQYDDVSELV